MTDFQIDFSNDSQLFPTFGDLILIEQVKGFNLRHMTVLTPQSQSSECNLPVPNVPWGDVFGKWFANFNFKAPHAPKKILFLNF